MASTSAEVGIACPGCGAQNDVWAFIDVTERPDLVAALAASDTSRTTCGSCGLVFAVMVLLYLPGNVPSLVSFGGGELSEAEQGDVIASLRELGALILGETWRSAWDSAPIVRIDAGFLRDVIVASKWRDDRDLLRAHLLFSLSAISGADSFESALAFATLWPETRSPDAIRLMDECLARELTESERAQAVRVRNLLVQWRDPALGEARPESALRPILVVDPRFAPACEISARAHQYLRAEDDPPPNPGSRDLETALAMFDHEESRACWATTSVALGDLYAFWVAKGHADLIDRGLAYYEQALPTLERFGDDDLLAHINRRRAELYEARPERRSEDIEQAIALYHKALETHRIENAPLAWAMATYNLGNTYLKRMSGDRSDNVEQALQCYAGLESVYSRHRYPHDWSNLYDSRGFALQQRVLGDARENVVEAVRCHLRALETTDSSAPASDHARIHANLGLAYVRLGHLFGDWATCRAVHHYDRVLGFIRGERTRERSYKAHCDLAGCHLLLASHGDEQAVEEALRHGAVSLKLIDRDAQPQDWAMSAIAMAQAYRLRRTGDRAQNWNEFVHWAREARSTAVDPHLQRDAARILLDECFERGEWRLAAEAGVAAAAAVERIFESAYTGAAYDAELERSAFLYSRLSYALLKDGQYDAALSHLERGKVRRLQEFMNVEVLATDSERREIAELRTEIRALEAQESTYPGFGVIEGLLRQKRAALAKLRAPTDRTCREPEADRSGSLLPRDSSIAAVVVTLVTDRGGALFVVPAGVREVAAEHIVDIDALSWQSIKELLVGEPSGLPGWIAARRDARSSRDTLERVLEHALERLWTTFAAPLLDKLQELGIADGSYVAISPQLGLNLLPLHAAAKAIGQPSLLDRMAVSYVPNGAVLRTCIARAARTTPGSEGLLAVANPGQDLDFAEIEAQLAAEFFPPSRRRVLVGPAATTAALADSGSYSHVHLACHGLFDLDSVERSHLDLHDRSLSLSELRSVLHFEATRLTTLSACESAVTDASQVPDEWVGMASALLEIGSAGVVSTLWPVQDLPAALLMSRFYEEFVSTGRVPADALRSAQLWLRDSTSKDIVAILEDWCMRGFIKPARMEPLAASVRSAREERLFAHPVFWAGFILVGV